MIKSPRLWLEVHSNINRQVRKHSDYTPSVTPRTSTTNSSNTSTYNMFPATVVLSSISLVGAAQVGVVSYNLEPNEVYGIAPLANYEKSLNLT